jgi:hypothetical protein
MGGFLIAFVLGCESPSNPTPNSASSGQSTFLSAIELSVADRPAWRELLHWDDDCEDAYELSYGGAESGLQRFTLSDEQALVAVLCAAGSYVPSFVYYYVEQHNSNFSTAQLQFPTFESADGETLAAAEQTELWGEPTFWPMRGELTVLRLARQTGDCGTWARYGFAGGQVQLQEFWAAFPCTAEPRTPVNPASVSPPAGWRRVDSQ